MLGAASCGTVAKSARQPKLCCTLRLKSYLCNLWRIILGPFFDLIHLSNMIIFWPSIIINPVNQQAFSARTRATDQGGRGAISVFLSIPKSSNILSGDDLHARPLLGGSLEW